MAMPFAERKPLQANEGGQWPAGSDSTMVNLASVIGNMVEDEAELDQEIDLQQTKMNIGRMKLYMHNLRALSRDGLII